MSNHLQPPWYWDRPKPSERHVYGYETDGSVGLVATCETDADADLIAAAPDMLAALQNITRQLLDEQGIAPIASDSAFAGCIKAIDKATGSENSSD